MSATPNLGMNYVVSGQASGEVTLNDALNAIDGIIQLAVQFVGDTPPGSPTNGQAFLVIATATGAWTSHEGQIALYYNGWTFLSPKAGWKAWDKNILQHMMYDGIEWLAYSANVAAIGSPGSATAADCANKINAILTAMKGGGIMTPD